MLCAPLFLYSLIPSRHLALQGLLVLLQFLLKPGITQGQDLSRENSGIDRPGFPHGYRRHGDAAGHLYGRQ
jgi:hypothetical protein